jgi:hypothetical protein
MTKEICPNCKKELVMGYKKHECMQCGWRIKPIKNIAENAVLKDLQRKKLSPAKTMIMDFTVKVPDTHNNYFIVEVKNKLSVFSNKQIQYMLTHPYEKIYLAVPTNNGVLYFRLASLSKKQIKNFKLQYAINWNKFILNGLKRKVRDYKLKLKKIEKFMRNTL